MEEIEFEYWRNGTYKELLQMLVYQGVVGMILFLLLPIAYVDKNRTWICVQGILCGIYILGYLWMKHKDRGHLSFGLDEVVLGVDGKETSISWNQIEEITSYSGKKVRAPRLAECQRGRYMRTYTILIKTPKKYYRIYNEYPDLWLENSEDTNVEKVELHQVYLQFHQMWQNRGERPGSHN